MSRTIVDDRGLETLLCDLTNRASALRDLAEDAMEHGGAVSTNLVDLLSRDIVREAEEVSRRLPSVAAAVPGEVRQ